MLLCIYIYIFGNGYQEYSDLGLYIEKDFRVIRSLTSRLQQSQRNMNISKRIFLSTCKVTRLKHFRFGYRVHRTSCTCSLHHRFFSSSTYDDNFSRSVHSPEEFWAEQAEQIVWHKKWDKVLDNSNPPFSRWYIFTFAFVQFTHVI